ncbi:MAG: NRDE family protein [Longimonas sp.]|uniref:NRDE family protein n=1 Tax=Longimonas sp. TaxID=2039626 RepID=UPI0033635B83
MCLIILGVEAHPDYPLIMASNRDEFYARPTRPARWWPSAPHICAGRDLKAGGTWCGLTCDGRWAALTNVRNLHRTFPDGPTRGTVVTDYLRDDTAPEHYLSALRQLTPRAPFNLLFGRGSTAYYMAHPDRDPQAVEPGWHGLSNAHLDTPWHKVNRGKQRIIDAIGATVHPEHLLDALYDHVPAPDSLLPDTGLPPEKERQVSSMFISGEAYGTRASTVMLQHRGGRFLFAERLYVYGQEATTRTFTCDPSVPEPADTARSAPNDMLQPA